VTDLFFAFVLSLAQRGTTKPVKPRRIELTRRRANEAMLRRHFRCELHFDAPRDVLDGVRRQSARRLLASTDLGMGEIAFVLGFEEVQ
jgi:transcriptional regulator GlxA family with amidase domain